MRWQITYVEPFLFLYMYTIFLMFPVEQQMIYRKVCSKHFNETYCASIYKSRHDKHFKDSQNIIQGEAAQWEMYIGICKTVPAIFSTIFFGAWSDRIGRKKILMLPMFGDFVNAVCYWLNAYYFSSPVSYLFIGNVVSAIFGNFATVLMGVFAYVADISKDGGRTNRVTILESMIYLGSVISHLTGGLMLEKYGFVPVYTLVVLLYVVLIVYLVFLKESCPSVGEPQKIKELFVKDRLVETIQVVTKKRKERYRMSLLLLFGCFFILVLLFTGINSITVFYVLHQPLNFRPSQIGYLFTEINAMKFVGATLVNLILIHKLKWSDYSIIILASFMYGGFTLSLALSKVEWHIYLAPLWCLGLGTGTPSTRAGLSKMVSAAEQGKLFSIAACLEVILSLVSSTMFNTIYKKTLHITPSFTFFFMATLSFIPLLLSVTLKSFGQRRQNSEDEVEMKNQASQNDLAKSVNASDNPLYNQLEK